MAQKEQTPYFSCVRCGDMAALLQSGNGARACCGPADAAVPEGPPDQLRRKHSPFVRFENGRTHVTVGDGTHPMKGSHRIEWVALMRNGALRMTFLNPGSSPEAVFDGTAPGTAYAYCGVHGLWKTDFE